jgi:hypothetical protein
VRYWEMKTKKKAFDCVAMKHQAQERIRSELAGLSREEELAYWRRIAEQARADRETPRKRRGERKTAEA